LPDGGPTAQLEEFRIVKRQLLGQVEELRRRVRASRPAHHDHLGIRPKGKTFCAVNLAMSIAAEKEAEVVLVDLDLARSSVSTLGLPGGPGLMDALVDPRIDVRDLVIPTDWAGFRCCRAGVRRPRTRNIWPRARPAVSTA
jgi:hypothetical protein